MYYIYHVHGVKIGVTDNVHRRLKEQGFSENEYTILEATQDIQRASDRERELQAQYGYTVDKVRYADKQKYYKRKHKPMELFTTKISTTFPVDKDKLKDTLLDNIGTEWLSPLNYSLYISDKTHVDWIMKNLQASKFANGKPFIYNKAYRNYLNDYENSLKESYTRKPIQTTKAVTDHPVGIVPDQFAKIRTWAEEKGILSKGDSATQFVKLSEEMGELAQGLLKDDASEICDAIGDCVVVLTNLAALKNMDIEECIAAAWDEIKDRTGKMEGGTFVKDKPAGSLQK